MHHEPPRHSGVQHELPTSLFDAPRRALAGDAAEVALLEEGPERDRARAHHGVGAVDPPMRDRPERCAYFGPRWPGDALRSHRTRWRGVPCWFVGVGIFDFDGDIRPVPPGAKSMSNR